MMVKMASYRAGGEERDHSEAQVLGRRSWRGDWPEEITARCRLGAWPEYIRATDWPEEIGAEVLSGSGGAGWGRRCWLGKEELAGKVELHELFILYEWYSNGGVHRFGCLDLFGSHFLLIFYLRSIISTPSIPLYKATMKNTFYIYKRPLTVIKATFIDVFS